jgi:hypothetical protein
MFDVEDNVSLCSRRSPRRVSPCSPLDTADFRTCSISRVVVVQNTRAYQDSDLLKHIALVHGIRNSSSRLCQQTAISVPAQTTCALAKGRLLEVSNPAGPTEWPVSRHQDGSGRVPPYRDVHGSANLPELDDAADGGADDDHPAGLVVQQV